MGAAGRATTAHVRAFLVRYQTPSNGVILESVAPGESRLRPMDYGAWGIFRGNPVDQPAEAYWV